MRQLWLFIKKYHAFFLFLLLEVIAIGYLMTKSRYQQAAFLKESASVQAKVHDARSSITQFLHLSAENEQLARQNSRLQEQLKALQQEKAPLADSTIVDTTRLEDTIALSQFHFRVARVISNPMNKSNSLLTIDKGRADSIHLQDGVMAPSGVIGKVVQMSEHYSLVMPLFHPNSRLNVKHKESNYNGNLTWNASNFQLLQVENIPRNARVEPGDTIVTNQYSKSFPEYSMVGVVENRSLDANGNFYLMNIRPAANFFRLNYVYVIQRSDLNEILELENQPIE